MPDKALSYHQRQAAAGLHPPDLRASASDRGYDHRWRRLRNRWLREHPLCCECEKIGAVTPATLVDHIKPIAAGGLPLDPNNLRSLCTHHHAAVSWNFRKHGINEVPPGSFPPSHCITYTSPSPASPQEGSTHA